MLPSPYLEKLKVVGSRLRLPSSYTPESQRLHPSRKLVVTKYKWIQRRRAVFKSATRLNSGLLKRNGVCLLNMNLH